MVAELGVAATTLSLLGPCIVRQQHSSSSNTSANTRRFKIQYSLSLSLSIHDRDVKLQLYRKSFEYPEKFISFLLLIAKIPGVDKFDRDE